MDKPGNVCTQAKASAGTGIRTTRLILARLHISKAVLLHYVTRAGTRDHTGFMHPRRRSTRSTRPLSLAREGSYTMRKSESDKV